MAYRLLYSDYPGAAPAAPSGDPGYSLKYSDYPGSPAPPGGSYHLHYSDYAAVVAPRGTDETA